MSNVGVEEENVSTMTEAETAMHDAAASFVADLRARMLFYLTIYPKMSPTMMQVALGPSTRAHVWKPILDQLIEEGLVWKHQVRPKTPPPSGRDQIYTVIELMPPKDSEQAETKTEASASTTA